jgi:hypothetical protein
VFGIIRRRETKSSVQLLSAMETDSDWNIIPFAKTSDILDDEQRGDFVIHLWNSKMIIDGPLPYFNLLQEERDLAQRDFEYKDLTFQFFITVRNIICNNPNQSRQSLMTQVRSEVPATIPDGCLKDLITMAIRLFLMVRVEFSESQVYYTAKHIPLLPEKSLQDALEILKAGQPPSDFNATDRYPLWFNAFNLEKKARMKII